MAIGPLCTTYRVKLRSSLFSADVLMQKAILEVQSICESISSSSFSHYFESEKARFVVSSTIYYASVRMRKRGIQ